MTFEQQVIKALCLVAASQDAAAVTSNLPDTASLDPTIKDEGIRAMNLFHHELKRIHFDINVQVIDSEQWRTPEQVDTEVRQSLEGVIDRVTGNPALQAILKGFTENPAVQQLINKFLGDLIGRIGGNSPTLPSPTTPNPQP